MSSSGEHFSVMFTIYVYLKLCSYRGQMQGYVKLSMITIGSPIKFIEVSKHAAKIPQFRSLSDCCVFVVQE